MILLANNLVTPGVGTIFWSALIFILFLLILSKFAWKPILSAVKARDEMIKGSLESAAKAREDMLKLQSDNEAILRKAREERENIIENAREGIENEKIKALSEIHEQVATLSVEIASKLLGEQLKKSGKQEKLIDSYLKEIDLNKN